MEDKSDQKSFWTTLPGILTGIAAVITAIATLYATVYVPLQGGVDGHTPTPTPTANPTPASTSILTPTPTSMSDIGDCFQEVPGSRTTVMEEGTRDYVLIWPRESKDEPIVVKFAENNKPIGYIKLFFFSNNQLFKIEKVVDPKCQQIEEYSNIVRGGDKHLLQNWDSVQIRFGDYNYVLNLAYDGLIIEADFERTV